MLYLKAAGFLQGFRHAVPHYILSNRKTRHSPCMGTIIVMKMSAQETFNFNKVLLNFLFLILFLFDFSESVDHC